MNLYYNKTDFTVPSKLFSCLLYATFHYNKTDFTVPSKHEWLDEADLKIITKLILLSLQNRWHRKKGAIYIITKLILLSLQNKVFGVICSGRIITKLILLSLQNARSIVWHRRRDYNKTDFTVPSKPQRSILSFPFYYNKTDFTVPSKRRMRL